jgi:hypothetical protein
MTVVLKLRPFADGLAKRVKSTVSAASAAQLMPLFDRIYGAARIAGFIKKICGPNLRIQRRKAAMGGANAKFPAF